MWYFVNKLAESFLFYVFPLVFSRKSIIFVAKFKINGCHADWSSFHIHIVVPLP